MILINVREYRRVITNGQDVNQTYKKNITCECHRQSKFGKNITTNRKLNISVLSYEHASPVHFFNIQRGKQISKMNCLLS